MRGLVRRRHHHRLVHEGGFGLKRTQAGEFRFTDPAGKRIADRPETRFCGNVFELMAHTEADGITITPETPIPGWLGESMDDSIVLHNLWLLER